MIPSGITPGAVGIWTLVAVAIGALIKAWPALRKIQSESDVSLRSDLMKRVVELEAQVAELNRKMTQKEADHAADMQVMRHALNNETTSLDALLLLLKTSPEKVPEAVDLVMTMRADRAAVLSSEKTAFTRKRMETAAQRQRGET